MITIIDYGIGNLRSVEKAFQAVGASVIRSDRLEDIEQAEKLVLPGVGAFGACASELRRRSLEEPILTAVASGKPLLGVCVGMQLLFEESEEMGRHRGLGLLPGHVVRLEPHLMPERMLAPTAGGDAWPEEPTRPLKVPHMGWNAIHPRYTHPLLEGLDAEAFFYFVHSYHAAPHRPDDVLASTRYGVDFPAVVCRNNVFGVQFHPEKSQRNGLRVLENFAKILA